MAREWFVQGLGGVMAVDEAVVSHEWVASHQVIEVVEPREGFVDVTDQPNPEASLGFMETIRDLLDLCGQRGVRLDEPDLSITRMVHRHVARHLLVLKDNLGGEATHLLQALSEH